MTSDRKNPLWPWIVALLIGLPVLYVLSFGPTFCLMTRGMAPRVSWFAYRPVVWLTFHGPAPMKRALRQYAEFWTSDETVLLFESVESLNFEALDPDVPA
jgi:hypothetical protein